MRRVWSAANCVLCSLISSSARAIKTVGHPFRRAVLQIGDDEADIKAAFCRFDARDGAPLPILRFGLVSRLGATARNVLVFDGARDADGAGCVIDLSGQQPRARKTKHVIDAVLLAPAIASRRA